MDLLDTGSNHSATIIAAPASATAVLQVDLDGQTVEVELWQPRGTLLPAPGDRCLLVITDTGEPAVPVWRPA